MQKQISWNNSICLKQLRFGHDCLEPVVRNRRARGRRHSKKKIGYWRDSEQLKYISFLRTHFLIMKNAQLRYQLQIFKKMSGFIRTRDPIQCKSHHQKMLMKNNNSLESIIQGEEASTQAPEYLYRQEQPGHMGQHLDKIQTNEQLPYFMIQSHRRLLIVIDQRFITSY